MKISLALIVKADDQEARKLDRCLASCAQHFDEIALTITGKNEACEKVALKYNAAVSHFDWVNDFAKARNFNFEQTTGDWIVWLDADDVLRGGDALRKNIELADANKVTGLSVMYHYAHDKHGKVTQEHWKLQAVKAKHYEWRGILHENLIAVLPNKEASIDDVLRIHTANAEDSENSLRRNLVILKEAIEKEPQEPRHYFYSARCYLGTGDWREVIIACEKYLSLSGWKEERYEAMNMMGEAYMRLGMSDDAIKVHTAATLELEDAPDAYIYKARNYIHKEEWLNALTNLEIADTRNKNAVILKHGALYDHDLYFMSAICLLNLGQFKEAVSCAERAYKNRGSDESKEIVELAQEMLHNEELTLAYFKIGKTMLEEPERAKHLIASMPSSIIHDPRILSFRFTVEGGKTWNANSVAIYCGNTADSWDGNALATGIGGSETAVIHIAKQLAKRGIEVVVYNRCDAPAEGVVIDGVLYKNHWEINRLDTFDVLWLWRNTNLLDYDLKARKVIVDLHDVTNASDFTPERLARVDHIFVKTAYHRSLYPAIPDEKFVIVGNGIDLTRFEVKETRNNNRIIYTSTQNRGLETILNWWPDIKAKAPDAELHVFYGWNTFYELNKDNPERMAWMTEMQAKMEQPGIVNHGRVDQFTLAKEMMKSNIWLYPTEFPEIHCITALEMQAAECYPITSGYAALAETQQSGVKIPVTQKDKYIAEIVNAIENRDLLKKDIAKGLDYVKSCTWDNVTDVWFDTLWNT
jgi:tetratricopeptide (TPR) repeat protein